MSCSASVVAIEFTEEDFGGRERGLNPRVPIRVAKNKQIGTRIILEVVPLTVEQANMTSLHLPENTPEHNPYAPPHAGNTYACTN